MHDPRKENHFSQRSENVGCPMNFPYDQIYKKSCWLQTLMRSFFFFVVKLVDSLVVNELIFYVKCDMSNYC